MSWLDFANYFLSNQKLHAWSWINRTSLGNGSFWWFFFLLLCVFGFWFLVGFFLFCFCLVRGAQDFGWQLKGEDHFRSWFPFLLFYSFGDNSVLFRYCLVQGPLGTFLLVSLTRSFLLFLLLSFFLSPILWLGIFFLFFLLSPTLWLGISFPFSFDWKFSFSFFLWLEIFLLFSFFFLLPRVRIGILTLGQGLWWVRILAQSL